MLTILLVLVSILLQGKMEAFFPPDDNCTAQAVKAIDGANVWVGVQAYSFTSDPIAAALCRAVARKVRVQIVIDATAVNGDGSDAAKCKTAGCEVYVDKFHKGGIAHNKVILTDPNKPASRSLLTGSFNWTDRAQTKNAENLLVIHPTTDNERDLFQKYHNELLKHISHSEPYVVPPQAAWWSTPPDNLPIEARTLPSPIAPVMPSKPNFDPRLYQMKTFDAYPYQDWREVTWGDIFNMEQPNYNWPPAFVPPKTPLFHLSPPPGVLIKTPLDH